jgi:hypothetical protein
LHQIYKIPGTGEAKATTGCLNIAKHFCCVTREIYHRLLHLFVTQNTTTMLLTSQPEITTSPKSLAVDAEIPARYKGWSISSKVINGKLWLRWQHPQENIPRYGCPVGEGGLSATVNHVRLMIDLTMKLESETHNHNKLSHQSSVNR